MTDDRIDTMSSLINITPNEVRHMIAGEILAMQNNKPLRNFNMWAFRTQMGQDGPWDPLVYQEWIKKQDIDKLVAMYKVGCNTVYI